MASFGTLIRRLPANFKIWSELVFLFSSSRAFTPPVGGLDEFGAGSPLSRSSTRVILSSIAVIGLRRLCRDDIVGASRHRIPAHRAGPDARGRPLQLQTRAGGALAGGLECPVHAGVSLPHGRAELGPEPVHRPHLLWHLPVASLILLLNSLPF